MTSLDRVRPPAPVAPRGAGHALEPLREFGPLHALAVEAFDLLQQGDAAAAERRSATVLELAEALGDDATARYCLHVRGRALVALGRPWDAVQVADALVARCASDALPYWRAKALTVRALALRDVGGHDMVDLLAEAWLLIGTPDGRVYNQMSAAVLMATALRVVELYEASDVLLSRLWRVAPADVAPAVAVDGARTLAEWAIHQQLMEHPDAGATFARLASRAELLRRLAPRTRWTGLRGFTLGFQALAACGLGDLPAAEALLAALRRTGWPRPGTPEWCVATYVAGSLACAAGRFDEGTADLRALAEAAVVQGHEVWAAAADHGLVRAETARHGPHPALAHTGRLVRRAAARWAAQQADRFDAVRSRMRLHALLVERDHAQRLSRVDALTGVGNRRALQDRLAAGQGPVAALFVDVDEFKSVNEAHSHVTGDAVLVQVARLVESCARPGDLVARYGGDEFVVLLADRTPPAPELLVRRAEAVVDAVRGFDWSGLAPGLALTVSVGTAAGTTRDVLLAELSDAVRSAKRHGRDRVHASGTLLAAGAG